MNTYKIALIGDGGVGKTTFVKRLSTGEFDPKYVATLGVVVTPFIYNTNYGSKGINIWDCAGQVKFGGLRGGYYVESHGAIVMFDLTSLETFKNVTMWIGSYREVMGDNVPIILCGNKCDVGERKVSVGRIQEFIENSGMKYYDISSKSNYNYDKPFLEILRAIENKPDLVITLE